MSTNYFRDMGGYKKHVPFMEERVKKTMLDVSLLHVSKALKRVALAGLLTCPISECLPVGKATVAYGCLVFGDFDRTHSSESVRDLHPVPFSFNTLCTGGETKTGAKVEKILR